MRGDPKPTWSQGRHAWLAELRDEAKSPSRTRHRLPAFSTRALGWTENIPYSNGKERLTESGRAMLAQWDAGHVCMPPPGPPVKGFVVTGLSAASLARQLLEHNRDDALAVYEALHVGLFGDDRPPAMIVPAVFGEVVAQQPAIDDCAMAAGDFAAPCACPPEVKPDPPPQAAPVERSAPRNFAPSIGTVVMPKGYSACLSCAGKGKTSRGWNCHACHGTGRIRRTVVP